MAMTRALGPEDSASVCLAQSKVGVKNKRHEVEKARQDI
jgi:hypothetical protein